MGSGFWFKTLIGLKRAKGRKSKHLMLQSSSVLSDEVKGKESATHYSNISASSRKVGRKTKLSESVAATLIQAAIRAYLARKALRRLRGVVRFKGVIECPTVKNQIAGALKQIHCWSNIQSEIRARRLCMVSEGRTRHKKVQNQLKLEAKLHELEVEWSSGADTMEEILQRIQQREEAAIKRERAMAYAFSHQWRANSSHYFGQAYYDLGKDSWGWSWKERWIAVRPWETRVLMNSHARQVAKVAKTTSLGPMKLVVSVKPSALSNGKDPTQGRRLSNITHEAEASQEADNAP